VASTKGLAVALLAAGRSTRFGDSDKLGAPLGGRALIEWAAGAGRSVNAAQHFVVMGPDFPQQYCQAGYRQVVNNIPAEGLASSLRLAACYARESGASALLILLGDMPLVTADHLRRVLALSDPTRPVFSRIVGGAAQPPALFPSAMFPPLEGLSGDNGARGLARDAAFVEAPADSLIDVDTPEDLARCERLIGA
jgi:molybdenum cofactor cytidylyltransferase